MNDQPQRLYERLLVLRCQTGDEAAYRELVERHTPGLRYYLRKLLPRCDRADDLVQEVWIAVFRQLPGLRDTGAFPAWVYRIARGMAMLELRRNGRAGPVVENLDAVAAPGDEPEFTADDAARIHGALDRLPSEHREVLVLRFLQELSYDEIGQIVNCPPGTVSSRIHYAKQALRRLLESDG